MFGWQRKWVGGEKAVAERREIRDSLRSRVGRQKIVLADAPPVEIPDPTSADSTIPHL